MTIVIASQKVRHVLFKSVVVLNKKNMAVMCKYKQT